ncbi:excalibur calcium-binding domain-containing protein [Paenibacillus sp. G2S3]|uniref:excalibur calcium-binding domain-containing protein n=1 Tax=Paenibacillus sp. G2S3 TaxID=3047872 RepID=UPI0024C1C94D|nr:excalibur calcium-binding domain-containing protein [Paenibacillus sp. G2S3]WHY21512.1 excalibur calcium-binding domain-containing protein [Paenibacillus sp. G2S3]
MKKYLKYCLSAGLLLALSIGTVSTVSAESKVKTYKNCTELNKVYKGGVAISSSTKNKGGKTKYKPFVSKALYEANKKSDRDKDGIACEK